MRTVGFMTLFLRLFRWNKRKMIFLDTSYISEYDPDFQNAMADAKYCIVDAVLKELGNGRRNNPKIFKIYANIKHMIESGDKKIIFMNVKPKYASLSVDDQILYMAKEYLQKGYNVQVVTCDKNQYLTGAIMHVPSKCEPALLMQKDKKSVESFKEDQKSGINDHKPETIVTLPREVKIPCLMVSGYTFVKRSDGLIANPYGKIKDARKLIPSSEEKFIRVEEGDKAVIKMTYYTFVKVITDSAGKSSCLFVKN